MLGGDHHQGVRAHRGELLAHAVVGGIEGFAQPRIGHGRTAGDAGGMAADAGKYQAHTPATFASISVVMVYTPARTGPWRATPSRIAWM